MKTYELTFKGRKAGAVGSIQNFVVQVKDNTIEEAWLSLYDDYQDIQKGPWRVVPTQKQINKTKNLLSNI